ncbi:MAG: glycosyltransferase family 2 protein [Eubacterium sp.]
MKSIDIVVPCYNEAQMLPMFFDEIQKVTILLNDYNFNYIFVDDGSSDNTLAVIKSLVHKSIKVKYISFSRNFGKESAMYAGLKYSKSDYVIIMDADLQHPPSLIPEMLQWINKGYDCCAAIRTARKGESKIRLLFSDLFFSLSNRMSSVQMQKGAVDYRIMSRQMVDAVLAMSEVQRFSKGIFSWVGFNTKWITYKNVERPMGKTKWSFWGLFKYALSGITSFSVTPLRMVSVIGFFISLFAFIYIIITLIQTLVYGITVPGYVTLLCAILFMGGILELSIGILGEYIGNIYMESKKRPIFITKETNITDEDKLNFDFTFKNNK